MRAGDSRHAIGGHVIRFWKFVAAAYLCAAPLSALAQQDRDQSPQLFLPNATPRGDQTYKVGEYILRAPILWYRAAIVRQEIVVTAGDRTQTLTVGTALPEEQLLTAENSGQFFTAYCTPRKASERLFEGDQSVAGRLLAGLVKSTTDAQFCLVDRDKDGRFDESLLVGSGWGELRTPAAITPTPYEIATDVPISPQDEVRIKFAGRPGAGPLFILEIIQQGRPRRFDFISSGGRYTAVANRENRIMLGIEQPQRETIYGAEFIIIDYNREEKTVGLRWPADVNARLHMQIPDGMSTPYTGRR